MEFSAEAVMQELRIQVLKNVAIEGLSSSSIIYWLVIIIINF